MAEAQTAQKPLAVVTGASRGIGFELAKILAKNGFDLVICSESDRIYDAAQSVAAFGAAVEVVQADLATPDGVEELYSRVISQFRPIDAVLLNAGIGEGGDFSEDTDLEQELKIIDLNVRSTVHLAKLFIKELKRQSQGRVLLTSSIAASMPGAYQAVYSASKAFVQSFAQAIREELKDSGITVTTLRPGATDTDFFRRAGMQDTSVGQGSKDDPAEVAEDGFQAMMAGEADVIAGSFMNKVMATAAKVLPEQVGAKAHSQMAKPKPH